MLAPGYCNTMGIKLLAGRDFDERDRHIGWGGDPGAKTEIEMIGVVSDTK